MSKVVQRPSTTLFPLPAVLVTSALPGQAPNIITVAWTGIMNSDPPVVYVSVRPSRHSHRLIKESGEYVINIPSADQVREVDYCGTVSGRDEDKFAACGFTPLAGHHVKAPLIKECPVNLECRVRQVLALGSHDVFVADVLAVHVDRDALTDKGRLDFEKIRPWAFCVHEYFALGGRIGTYGFSKKG